MLFVKIVNNEVKECWDTQPPAGEAGWKSAIEVRPPIVEGRQYYTGHTFDITKDPVEIVYGVEDLTVEGRKEHLKNQAKYEYQQIANAELQKDLDGEEADVTVVQSASAAYKAKAAEIDACTTHDELNAL
jgi:hypothetical protein